MNQDLKVIKKKYGEKMAHFCREYFPTLLEKEGLLSSLLLNNFNASHILYNDLVEHNLLGEFKEYIYSLVDVEHLDDEQEEIFSPGELLSSVGYDIYECHTEKEIQSFRKYYAKGEKLCTFKGDRLDTCWVFFAVKKNVDEIKREDFKNPQRQDLYGTSVISIQFDKLGGNRLSIKNRYNHTVNNPDSTFSNNLDNIVPGLTKSFEKYYGIKQRNVNKGFEIPSYVMASDRKYYKYNYEIYNVYYCPDNIIIKNGNVEKLSKEEFLVFDYFILDLQNKKLTSLINDGFIDSIGTIKKIEILNWNLLKKVLIYQEDESLITIVLDNENNIVGLDNPYVKEVPNDFLYYNKKCKMVRLESAKIIKSNFMGCNRCIEKIYFENVEKIGLHFLSGNIICQQVILPNAITISDYFMLNNKNCDYIFMPNLEKVGTYFMDCNEKLRKAFFPKLKSLPLNFMPNAEIKIAIFSKLEIISDYSSDLSMFKSIQYLYAPKLYLYYSFHICHEIPEQIFEKVQYCYTPLLPKYCNTTNFLQDEEIVESLKLELKKKENVR